MTTQDQTASNFDSDQTNRYALEKFKGSLFRAYLKRLYWNLRFRPRNVHLGESAYIQRPFFCPAPHKIHVGHRSQIGRNSRLQPLTSYLDQCYEPKIEIADDVYIGNDCHIVCVNYVYIGTGCTLSDEIYITDVAHGMHPYMGLIMDQELTSKGPVILANGCFIGIGSTILSGVTIGTHSIIGARSVVTRSIPPYCMASGNPARIISCFDKQLGVWVRCKES